MDKVQYTIRLEEPLLEQLKIIAQKELRSLNNQIEYFIAKGIEQRRKPMIQKKQILICDKCGKKEEIIITREYQKTDFHQIGIIINRFNLAGPDIETDLCSTCFKQLCDFLGVTPEVKK